MTTLPQNEVSCSGDVSTRAKCEDTLNGVWISVNGSDTNGVCHCCDTSTGTVRKDPTNTITPCVICPSNSACGDFDGQCKGSTGDSKIRCIQDPTKQIWTPLCEGNTTCSGMCSGSCGASEWFLFHRCTKDPNGIGYNCSASWDQWKSWFVWGLVALAILLFFVIYAWRKRPKIDVNITDHVRKTQQYVIKQKTL